MESLITEEELQAGANAPQIPIQKKENSQPPLMDNRALDYALSPPFDVFLCLFEGLLVKKGSG